MKTLGYYNGKISELEEMQVPMLDRACYFGDGVYDAALAHNYNIYCIDTHINRFFNSARLMDINLPCSKEELKETLNAMVHKMDDPDLFVYWQVSRGSALRNHVYPENMMGNLWIMIWPTKVSDKNRTLHLVTVEDTRFLHNNIKSINLIPAVRYATDAARTGYDECLLHRDGRVTECAHSNLSILKNGCFYTAPTDEYILPGIERKHLIEACEINNILVKEIAFTLEDVMNADEIIVSSSSMLCLRVSDINHQEVGGKDCKHFQLLQDYVFNKFEELCK